MKVKAAVMLNVLGEASGQVGACVVSSWHSLYLNVLQACICIKSIGKHFMAVFSVFHGSCMHGMFTTSFPALWLLATCMKSCVSVRC
jgi:hypothetical protein